MGRARAYDGRHFTWREWERKEQERRRKTKPAVAQRLGWWKAAKIRAVLEEFLNAMELEFALRDQRTNGANPSVAITA